MHVAIKSKIANPIVVEFGVSVLETYISVIFVHPIYVITKSA